MYVSNKICFDKKDERIIGPHKTVQTIIVRGLFTAWKQVIYYNYDSPMKKEILLDVISKLYSINYTVVAMVRDLGPTNAKLLKSMDIDCILNNYFCHPVDLEKKVFVFNDVPHLIKLVRNNLFDRGFIINSKHITKALFEKIVELQSGDVKLTHKLTQRYLDVRGNERQKVKFAVQCLSHTVAQVIRWCGQNNLMGDMPWNEGCEFNELIKAWFDLFNSRIKFSAAGHAFGINIEEQVALLQKVTDVIEAMQV